MIRTNRKTIFPIMFAKTFINSTLMNDQINQLSRESFRYLLLIKFRYFWIFLGSNGGI